MTLQEFYVEVGGDYNEALGRLMNEKFMMKYITKYLDQKDFELLHQAIEEKNWTDGFRCSHTMKGVALNLGFGSLAKSSSALCETMRVGAPTVDIAPLLAQVDKDQAHVLETIRTLLGV